MNNCRLAELDVKSIHYSAHNDLRGFKITHDFLTSLVIIMLFEGSMVYSIGQSGEYALEAGELLLLPAYYNVDKIGLTSLSIGLLRVELGKDADKIQLGNPVMKINDRMMEDVRLLSGLPNDSGYRSVLLSDIWYQICMSYVEPRIPMPKEREAPLKALLDYVQNSLSEKLTLDELCRFSGYSKSSLIREFRIYTGQTPMSYINDLRLNNVKKLLGSKEYTLREIAACCGFANEFYLSTAFKQKTGMSPSEFRRKYI